MRYAIYYTPAPDSPLASDAGRWLGRDAFSGEMLGAPGGLAMPSEQWQGLVAEPQRYGFHATLKAPFELRDGQTEAALVDAFDAFAASVAPFDIPEVVVGQLGPFFALVPAVVHAPLQAFAASVVETFEPFRAPLSDADVARRRPERLTETQRENLTAWGYPYVMDEFRFHMTLTGPVEDDLAPTILSELKRRFSRQDGQPLAIDGLALFIEARRGEPFTIHSWRPLGLPAHSRKILP